MEGLNKALEGLDKNMEGLKKALGGLDEAHVGVRVWQHSHEYRVPFALHAAAKQQHNGRQYEKAQSPRSPSWLSHRHADAHETPYEHPRM